MEKKVNTYKFYRTVATVCGLIGGFVVAVTLVRKDSASIYASIIFATLLSVFYINWLAGKLLERRFKLLGDSRGKSRTEIEAVVGVADEVRILSETSFKLLWTMTTYQVILEFSCSVCDSEVRPISSSELPHP